MAGPYKGEIGVEFVVETGIDISAASSVELKVRAPDGSLLTWTGEAYETTSIRYVTESGDLNQTGLYILAAKIKFGDEKKYFGRPARFLVRDATANQ